MRYLILIRHAKSSWDDENLADFDRPLNKRGLKDAPVMGQRLRQKLQRQLDHVYSSPAKRAITTAETIVQQLDFRPGISALPAFYTFDYTMLLQNLQSMNDKHQHVAVVGHNPAITTVVNHISDLSTTNMPTCAVVQLELDIPDWSALKEETARCIDYDYPKNG